MRKFILLVTGILAISTAAILYKWVQSRPSWQLTALNSAEGVILRVYKSDATTPTFTTLLSGRKIETESDRATRPELPPGTGLTTTCDETIKPGSWTLVLAKTKIDIMERALIIDDVTEILPAPTTP